MDLQIISQPVERREFERGRFEVFQAAGRTFGVATYEPGWRWAEHVGRKTGEALCQVEHLGYVVSGTAAVRMQDGSEVVMKAGDFFAIPPGHDSWVIGEEEYVSLHLLGAEAYARG
jgi:quercetin dioxygenase-like cupin family protein